MRNIGPQDHLVRVNGLAERVLEALARHELAPTPEIYRLWYAHLAGENPELSRILRVLLTQGQALSEDRCAELYERFYGSGQEERLAQRACQRLQELICSLLEEMERAGHGAAWYGSALHDTQRRLDSGPDPSSLGSLLRAVVDETRNMLAHAARLERNLKESSAKITALRQDLSAAWREARTDGLTGAANRKQFDAVARASAAQALEQNTPLCLMLADIDHFKKFNDLHGHRIGDNVLRLVSVILRQQVKGQDLVARYGGEEFAIILPRTGLRDAFSLANRIRELVASRQVRVKENGSSLGRVTLSIGVTGYHLGEPVSRWIERADEALYAAKKGGRNRVVALPPASPLTVQSGAA